MADKTNGDKKKLKLDSKLIVAKVIAFAVFLVVMLLLFTEVVSMTIYGVPYISTEIARNFGVQTGADWVAGSILWFLPSVFIVIILAQVHFYVIKVIVKKMWRWMTSVMKQSSY